MSSLQKEAVELANAQNVKPAYKRIAIGNYLGMMANTSSTLARIYFGKSKGKKVKEISENDALELLKHMLEASKIAKIAYEENPEWEQYSEGARQMDKMAEEFLLKNPDIWLPMIVHFESNLYILNFMKNVDYKMFKKVENSINTPPNKISKLWSIASLWIVIFLIIFFR